MDRGGIFYPVMNPLKMKKTREILECYCPDSPMPEYKWSTAGRCYFTASTSGFDGDTVQDKKELGFENSNYYD